MSTLKLTLASAAAVAVAASLLFTVAPAVAAGRSLATTDALYAITWDNNEKELQLYGVDAATGASTPIGTGTDFGVPGYIGAGQPAWNGYTSTAYFLAYLQNNVVGLATIDLATGVSTYIADITVSGAPVYASGLAIGIDGGGAQVIVGKTLYDVDLATGVLTEPFALVMTDDAYSFAASPVTGTYYALDIRGRVYEIATGNGVATFLYQLVLPPDTNPYSVQVDSNDMLWIANDGEYADLWSAVPETAATEVLSGLLMNGADVYYSEALLVVPNGAPAPAPALAATGSTLPVALMASFGMLVLAGGIVLVRRRANA